MFFFFLIINLNNIGGGLLQVEIAVVGFSHCLWWVLIDVICMLLVIFDSQEWGNLNLDIFVGNIKEVFIELQGS